MNKIFPAITIFLLFTSLILADEQKGRILDQLQQLRQGTEHGQDPYKKIELDVTAIIKGSQSEPLAVVNDKMVKQGDIIDGAQVIIIGKDFVTFKIQNEITTEYLENFKYLLGGMEVNDIKDANNFELINGDREEGNDIEGAGDIELEYDKCRPAFEGRAVYARFYKIQKGEYKGHVSIFLAVYNLSNIPIQFNYFLDEYYVVNKRGDIYKFSAEEIPNYYPDYLNPNHAAIVYRAMASWFESKYVKLDDIGLIYCLIDNKSRFILLKPCPNLDKFELTDKEIVASNAFKEFTESLKRPKFPERYPKSTQNYQNTSIEMGSSHINMMPVLLEIVKPWHSQIDFIYGHYRKNYVLLKIEFNKNIDADTLGQTLAKVFSKDPEIEGRIEIMMPAAPYSVWWYFQYGAIHPSE